MGWPIATGWVFPESGQQGIMRPRIISGESAMPSRQELANAIRFLSMDAVQAANSGHPGAPMGMADIAEVLWNDFLKHNPKDPSWFNRDRFVLSNGHASMMLYSLLHLSGYDLPIEQIKQFRQLHSQTPGHPEHGETPGVETTTGPLGQGLSNAVGMALAEKHLAAQFNQADSEIINHNTYVFAGDGDLMEGVSHEVASLAGVWELGKLIVFWDDNNISIDGPIDTWYGDDTAQRFEAYGWQVISKVDGHDPEAIKQAIEAAKTDTHKPTLICCKTTMAFGSPTFAGSHKAHGAPLGDEEIQRIRDNLKWPHEAFHIPDAIRDIWNASERGSVAQAQWQGQWETYADEYPNLAKDLQRRMIGKLPEAWEKTSQSFIEACQQQNNKLATRKASQNCLNEYAPLLSEMMGGSADLTGSNNTDWKDCIAFNAQRPRGNYIHYGVREFGMSAIMNGMALHGALLPFAGTFLTFSDYARNAVRMSGLMNAQVIYVYSHDSIGLGEDGPTHQPIEHAAMLRYTPNVDVWRPCDEVETAVAWQQSIEKNTGPSCLLLTRQGVAPQQRDIETLAQVKRGGYILKDSDGAPDLLLLATGSEVGLAAEAQQQLAKQGLQARVISMPCTERFDRQDKAYKEQVLPSNVRARIAVEAASKDFWYKYVGLDGAVIGMESFGASAPANELYEYFGITVKAIVEKALVLSKPGVHSVA